jgi:hypothetical protein
MVWRNRVTRVGGATVVLWFGKHTEKSPRCKFSLVICLEEQRQVHDGSFGDKKKEVDYSHFQISRECVCVSSVA